MVHMDNSWAMQPDSCCCHLGRLFLGAAISFLRKLLLLDNSIWVLGAFGSFSCAFFLFFIWGLEKLFFLQVFWEPSASHVPLSRWLPGICSVNILSLRTFYRPVQNKWPARKKRSAPHNRYANPSNWVAGACLEVKKGTANITVRIIILRKQKVPRRRPTVNSTWFVTPQSCQSQSRPSSRFSYRLRPRHANRSG